MRLFQALSAGVVVFPWLAVLMAAPSAAGGHGPHLAFGAPQISTINGQPVPGRILPLQDVAILIDTLTSSGQHLLVMRGTRKAGTRMAIHLHEHVGFTCVLTGVITIFMDGREPEAQPAGTCYYMPANTLMAAANLGREDAILTDHFIAPPGEPVLVVREPGYPDE